MGPPPGGGGPVAHAPTITRVNPDRGPTTGDTTITITGTGFARGATVSVRGRAATRVSVVSATTITAVTPAGALGAADVVVHETAGTATGRGAFTYVSPPAGGGAPRGVAPHVTRNPRSAAVFLGQRVTLTAAATGRSTPTVQWQSEAAGQHVFRAIRGATHTTYVTPKAGRGAVHYRAVFRNPVGSATTAVATVSASPAPATHPVFFATAKAILTGSDKRTLDALRRHLAGITSVVCTGYTDSRGDTRANGSLGLARARAACTYLLRGTHVTAVPRSSGETHPFASNGTPKGQALNRRAMFVLRYPAVRN